MEGLKIDQPKAIRKGKRETCFSRETIDDPVFFLPFRGIIRGRKGGEKMGKNEVAVDKAELASLKESVQNLTAENERLRQKLEHMNELLLNAQRARFGQSSEKKAYVMPGRTAAEAV